MSTKLTALMIEEAHSEFEIRKILEEQRLSIESCDEIPILEALMNKASYLSQEVLNLVFNVLNEVKQPFKN